MSDFYFRTEDILPDELSSLFVETSRDREVIEKLKSRTPIILVGSRGVGKSFLLRMAEQEMLARLHEDQILPIYTSFIKSSLLVTQDPLQFQHYMLARICSRVLRALQKSGKLLSSPASLAILSGGSSTSDPTTRMEAISLQYENSFQSPGSAVDFSGLPSVENFRDAVEDVCQAVGIKRLVLLMDEAAHVFRPAQQRQFFTLIRDLRSPFISCNAAVYPGVTAYGDVFQPAHDAAFEAIDRDVLSNTYISQMREIVVKQATSTLAAEIARNGQNFAVLAYAATGNPRLLLKTAARAGNFRAAQVNEIIKDFYRTEIWTEHSLLPQNYPGHRALIDWGRNFVESVVLPDIQRRNDAALLDDGETTSYFWIHRDASEVVREAMRLLEYTGVVREHTKGIKATRGEVGTRYGVNLGCLFALESNPRESGFRIAQKMQARRFVEYGPNHSSFQGLLQAVPNLVEVDPTESLTRQLQRPVNVLDITSWQEGQLKKIGAHTIGAVLSVDERGLKTIKYIGDKRARRMMNAAIAAVMEYLSG